MSQSSSEGRSAVVLVAVQGGISNGKSRRMDVLRREIKRCFPGVRVLDVAEPVDEWMAMRVPRMSVVTSKNGTSPLPDKINALEHYYEDPQANAALFQMIAYMTRQKNQRAALAQAEEYPEAIVLSERDLEADRAFTEINCQYGNISPLGWVAYDQTAQTHPAIKPDVTLMIDTPFDVTLERIIKRGREGEVDLSGKEPRLLIDLDYFRDVHETMANLYNEDTGAIVLSGMLDLDHATDEHIEDWVQPAMYAIAQALDKKRQTA